MNYLITAFHTVILIRLLSFASYNWQHKNKLAAIGAALIGMSAFGLAIYVLFFGNYEL